MYLPFMDSYTLLKLRIVQESHHLYGEKLGENVAMVLSWEQPETYRQRSKM